MLLPIVTEKTRAAVEEYFQAGDLLWQKQMIQKLKEENPEVNTALLSFAQQSDDPKSVITAGYLIYKALELAQAEEEQETLRLIEYPR